MSVLVLLLVGAAATPAADKDVDFTVGSVKAKAGKAASNHSKPRPRPAAKARVRPARKQSSAKKVKPRLAQRSRQRKRHRRVRRTKNQSQQSRTGTKRMASKPSTRGTTSKPVSGSRTVGLPKPATGSKTSASSRASGAKSSQPVGGVTTKPSINLTGTWETTDGWTVHLKQKGTLVTGNYSGSGLSGTLRGTLNGTNLATTFQHRQGDIAFSGKMNLSYSEEEDTLDGRWSAGDYGEPISATRISK